MLCSLVTLLLPTCSEDVTFIDISDTLYVDEVDDIVAD